MKEQVLAVQRMQDYIEQNNAKEISLSDLSKASLVFAVVFIPAFQGVHRHYARGVHTQIQADPGGEKAARGRGKGDRYCL